MEKLILRILKVLWNNIRILDFFIVIMVVLSVRLGYFCIYDLINYGLLQNRTFIYIYKKIKNNFIN